MFRLSTWSKESKILPNLETYILIHYETFISIIYTYQILANTKFLQCIVLSK